MSDILYMRLTEEHLADVRNFCRNNWGNEHPLIHNDEMFDFYYRDKKDINFVVAYAQKEVLEETGLINIPESLSQI